MTLTPDDYDHDPDYDGYDNDYDDYDQDCGMTQAGTCVLAGSEFCSFMCRDRDWYEAMSEEGWAAFLNSESEDEG